MKQTFISQIAPHLGKKTIIKGWVYNKRFSGKIGFLQIRDGSGFIQGVISEKEVESGTWDLGNKLTLESSVIVHGTVTKHPRHEVYELQITDIELVHMSEEYPIGKKEHGPDFLLDNRHLWLRSNKQWAIQRVRNTVINATYEYLNKDGFIKIDSPILTPAACEGTTTLFEINYFDMGKAYLSQSGQLYIEAAIMSHGRVFDFGPVFRAEKSKTRRHLTEFWMMDAEAAFVEHDENLKIQENLISFIAKSVLEKNQNELKILERDPKPLEKIQAPFYRMTHAEAVAKLRKLGSDIKEDDDLGADDETLITKELDKPLFVEKYPAKAKAFYMKRDPANPELALCADLLAPEGFGEIVGGSQREESYDTLLTRLKEHNLPVKAFEWYLDLRKYGSVPHSGFGYGLERIVGWMCGTPHVRETIPFPRMLNRLYP
ncbi:MAG: asparagine--tRNA ligase [Deltaproteobacteria bacterium CG11_big_fil_rev_8_21_14_0_20_49_13]|nr:MAG: asparagine--tRNA ligase [Deltaproteobacteria bacterium CG11_big_fil_rev_8_21_14_0_20_49_13]